MSRFRGGLASPPGPSWRWPWAAALLLACVLMIGLPLSACRGRPPAEGASVLLVTIDTLRPDRLGAYGARDVRTPHLDALAARGLRFEEALASVPLTLPSHSTILSGLEPPRHGVRDNGTYVFPQERDTLATILKAKGYATGAFVGAYVLDRRFGLARGFGHYDDRIERRPEGASVLESERTGGAVVEAAAGWIDRQTGPFLAWVHLYDPHAPYDPPSPYREQYQGRPYDGEVAYTDACVGRLLTAAEGRGRRILLAVVADHGEGLGEHSERTHGFFVYQSTLRVPLLLAGPGIPQGERHPGPARTADILPTLLARLGIPAPAGLDGADLLGAPQRREAYAETLYPRTMGWAPLHAYRVGSLKYIDAPRPELYDLAADPEESRNLAADRPQDASRLRSWLSAFRKDDRPAAPGAADPEVAERLRALGYVGAAPAEVSGPLKDPKDALEHWRAFEEAIGTEARGDREAAIAGFWRLVDREPGNAAFRRNLAAALRRAGRNAEAVAVLADLVALAPNDPVGWHERSVALAAIGRTEEAIEAAKRAIALNPLLPEPQNHLGILQAEGGRAAEALRAFETATALDPNNARAWNNRGNALRGLGRRAEAGEAYRTAARLAPRDVDPRNGLGVLAVEAGDLQTAAALFREVLAIEPAHHDAQLNLAFVESRLGLVAEARSRLVRLLREKPDAQVSRRARSLLAVLPGDPPTTGAARPRH